jgi:fatty acid desaturase
MKTGAGKLLRYAADRRTLVVMTLVTAVFALEWMLPRFSPLLFTASIVLSLQVAVLAHNHHHTPTWNVRALNVAQSYWLTFFYGLPALSWLAIHNQSHHAHGNEAGLDCTSTHNVDDRNDLVGLLAYTPACTGGFWRAHGRAFVRFWRRDKAKFAYHASHVAFLWGAYVVAYALDWKKAVLFVALPQTVAILSITTFNFAQHAHAVAGSKYDVTRNFVSPVLNFYLFNAGYHTVHHLKPALHWSLIPAEHGAVAAKIDPRLEERSFWAYFFGVVVRGTFSARHKSVPLYAVRPSGPGAAAADESAARAA